MSRSGCLPFLLVPLVVAVGASQLLRKGRLIFVAPVDAALTVTVDDQPPILVAPGKAADAFVRRGRHTVTVVDAARGARTVTVGANLRDALLVPATSQCFLLLDVSELYRQEPGLKMPSDWRPPVVERLSSEVVVAPKHIFITSPPRQIRHEPGAPLRILYPCACDEEDVDGMVAAWTRRYL